jgi:Flp pilus assembly protein TadG
VVTRAEHGARDERGQVIVIFALALVAIVAMVGLVLDGGSAFAQRRSEQNAADLAALAAANDLIVNQGSANWVATARSVAAKNGFTHGSDGVTVDVTCWNCPGQALTGSVDGVQVQVDINAPHRNNFAGVVGMSSWDVSATARSKTGWPNTAVGPGPFIVSINAFDEGNPIGCNSPEAICTFHNPQGGDTDQPKDPDEFTWTNFGYDKACEAPGNVNSFDLQAYIANRASFSTTLDFGCYVAQHNTGTMDVIVQMLEIAAPLTFPIPVVDEEGKFVGFTTFVLTGANPNGANGGIEGYFEEEFQNQQLDVFSPGFGNASFNGSYVLKLVN